MTLPASLISRAHRGSMSHPGAAAGERRSVRAGASGKDRARPHPARTRAGTSGTRAARPRRIRDRTPTAPAPERRPDIEGGARRERPSRRDRDRDRDRERPQPHDRAGEPGYVPRRERLRSGEPAFGAEIFPAERNGRNARSNPLLEGEIDPRMADLADEDDPSSFPDAEPAGPPGAARPDGRRRRRRRGRRRERERPKSELSSVIVRSTSPTPNSTISPRTSSRRSPSPAAGSCRRNPGRSR